MRYTHLGLVRIVSILYYQGLLIQAETVDSEQIEKTKKNETPIAVSLAYNDISFPRGANHFCSGALISVKHVITISPCIDGINKDEIVILAGSVDLNLCKPYEVHDWQTYNEWVEDEETNSSSLIHDVAIIILRKSVEGHDDIFMAALPYYKNFKLDKRKATLFGWGISDKKDTSTILESIPIRLSGTPFCLEHIKSHKLPDDSFLNDYFVCSVADIHAPMKCGDKGGPIVGSNGLLVGIIFGTCPLQDDDRTALINFHHRIWPYKEFIIHVVSADNSVTSDSP